MKLVIVESPTKAKTIGKFLGEGYEIIASMGHVMDLPKSKLGVDTENNFTPQYEISEDKEKTIAEIKKLAKKSDEIILATDPDREGEAIAAHIKEVLEKGKFERITFHEITKEAIEEALKKPGEINTNLVNAQTARRVLDRLVGYKLSPLLWQKVRRGLSAGRVQSVALRLIVEREREIEKFKKENYFTINVILVSKVHSGTDSGQARMTEGISFELIEINSEKIESSEKLKLYDGEYTYAKTTINSQEKADEILKDLEKKIFTVLEVLQKETKRSPQPPFTTSTLQQQGALRFGFSGKRTMSLAQKLYEEGYITYHRTDSVSLSYSAVFSMREYAKKSFGEKYIPEKPRFYSTRQKLAQEAHEGIRPTKIHVGPETVQKEMGRDFGKLYEMIWRRALASQMSDAIVESTTVSVDAKGNSQSLYLFKTTGSVLLFDGFLRVNPFGLEDKKLPKFTALENLDLISKLAEIHETTPPPRYNDASLIKSLEEGGVGRPSTYATIISVLEERNYVERDQRRFLPTSVGIAVNDFLVKNFSTIDDIPFTAKMEDELDKVANENTDWVPMIRDFYTPFEKQLEITKKADRVEIPTEETGEMCPKDGAPLVIRVGRFGKFVSCKNFPNCDFKKSLIEETNFICPKDGGKIIVKKTRKGRKFYGCSNYPACTYAAWKIDDVKKGIIPSPAAAGSRNRREKLEDVKKGVIPEEKRSKHVEPQQNSTPQEKN